MSTSTKLSASQKGLAPVLIVLLIGIAIGGYFVYQNQLKPTSPVPTPPPQQTNPSSSIQTQQITKPSPNLVDATNNWKLDTNDTISLTNILKKMNFEVSQDDITNNRYKYTAMLYGKNGEILKQRVINISVLGWDLGLLQRGDQTSFIYNPNTDTIILPLVSLPGGIGGNKPEGVLPDSPYAFAIYTTTFKDNDKLNLIYSTEDIFDLISYIFNPDNNTLYLSTTGFDSTLYSFDLNSKQMKSLMNTQVHQSNEASEQVNYGDLLFSKDQEYLIQKFDYYLKNQKKEGYILYNLKTGKGEYKYTL